MKIGKTYRFEAAHHLPGHKGKCADEHGHSYRLEVEMEGGIIDEPGASDHCMVEDFEMLDLFVKEVIANLDHTDLNESAPAAIGCSRTTAEGLVLGIAGTLVRAMDTAAQSSLPRQRIRRQGIKPHLSRVRLYETEKCYAEWTA